MATENVDNPSAACHREPETAADGYTIPASFDALSTAVRAGTLPMPEVAGALANSDANLLSLYGDYQALRVAIGQIDQDLSDQKIRAELAALGASITTIVRQIRNAPAESAMGLLVKLRIVVAEMYGKPENVFEQFCADSALRMERQLGQNGMTAAATPDPRGAVGPHAGPTATPKRADR